MRLIPPQNADTEAVTTPNPPATTLTPDMQARVKALQLLNDVGKEFSATLEHTIKRIMNAEVFNATLSLAAFLRGGTQILNSISTNGQEIPELSSVKAVRVGGDSGHTGSNRPASGSRGTARRGRGRPPGSGKKNTGATGVAGSGTVKRGRGRPKGSKNRTTLERELAVIAQSAPASRPAARRKPRKAGKRGKPGRTRTQRSKPAKRVVRTTKAVTRKTVARKAVRKPHKPTAAHSRKRSGSSRRKGTPETTPVATPGTEGTV